MLPIEQLLLEGYWYVTYSKASIYCRTAVNERLLYT